MSVGSEDEIKNSISEQIAFISLLIAVIILGIILPVMLFTKYVLVLQIVCSILFISPIIYSKYKADRKTSRLMDKILYLSRHDDLTNIYNRRHFEELFFNSIEDTINSRKSFSLVFFDIDNLKLINDNRGHHVGDQVILTFSEIIKNNIRGTDLFARYGGDEFVVVFFNIEEQLVKDRVKNIEKQLEKNPIYNNGEKFFVKFSYGISNFPEDADEFMELIKMADQRMYLNKKHLS